ncbi:prepilin-type N-terminal cleavage/methylation domain-containing protein [Frigoribacterium faeni]|uniref:type II secretion system protein n=1 Tax=Frigoribacterium faeni TaxID=145483 RepID=UPI00141B96D8|nr:prepilin-type N-terminal cleavage/methylation domain-containing protein [Frigoribacterium faeni]
MYFALMGKLSARRQNLAEDKDKGFTLIELLVVVIIIGILAAIAIPVYLNVQNNARDSSVKSDLSNAKIAVVAYQTEKGTAPTAAQFNLATLADYGFTQSTDTVLSYGTAPTAGSSTFCINGKGKTEKPFSISNSGSVKDGAC